MANFISPANGVSLVKKMYSTKSGNIKKEHLVDFIVFGSFVLNKCRHAQGTYAKFFGFLYGSVTPVFCI